MREYYLRDILILLGSVLVAFVCARIGIFEAILDTVDQVPYLASFIAGMLFTSIFTIAPATIAIGELALRGTPLTHLIFLGALGGMTADFVIFFLLREGVAEPILLLAHKGNGSWIARIIKKGKHRIVGTIIGAIIIASPFPDEIGLLLMGLSRARWYTTLMITYCLNVIGIATVALLARSL